MAARVFAVRLPQPPPGALQRALIAGGAWGMAYGLGMIAFAYWQCGTICLPDAPLTVLISIVAGIGTIGPLAAFGRQATLVSNTRKQS